MASIFTPGFLSSLKVAHNKGTLDVLSSPNKLARRGPNTTVKWPSLPRVSDFKHVGQRAMNNMKIGPPNGLVQGEVDLIDSILMFKWKLYMGGFKKSFNEYRISSTDNWQETWAKDGMHGFWVIPGLQQCQVLHCEDLLLGLWWESCLTGLGKCEETKP